MKKIFIFIIMITYPVINYSQTDSKTDPENIIIVNKNGKKNILYKNELSKNPDSIHQSVIEEVMENYFIDKDSTEVSKFLVGKWKFKTSVSSNGNKMPMMAPLIREFRKNGEFIEIYENEKDTVTGHWQFSKNGVGNLNLQYDKTQRIVKDKSIWNMYDEETKKRLSYNETTLTVHQVDKKKLRFVSRTVLDNKDFSADIYFRIVFIDYIKKE